MPGCWDSRCCDGAAPPPAGGAPCWALEPAPPSRPMPPAPCAFAKPVPAIRADRANHDLLADDVARRAVHAERFRQLEIFLERGAHFLAAEILFQLRHVETGFLGRGKRARLVGGAAAAQQLLVEVEIFLA